MAVKPATGQEHDVSSAQRIKDGDTLKTSAGSLADVTLADLASMRLGPQTSARVLRTDGGLTLDLTQGGLCVNATSGQVGISSGVTLTSATAPAVYSVMTDDSGGIVLAVYRGDVRTGGGLTAVAGSAYSLSPTGAEKQVLLSSLDATLAPLECPDAAIIAEAKSLNVQIAKTGGGGGGVGVLAAVAGVGLIAAAAGGHGGGGSSSPAPPPGTLAASPASLALAVSGTGGTVTVTEANYTGPITATSSNAAVASVSPASASGPTATFRISGVVPGNATLKFADDHGQTQSVSVSIAGALIVSPLDLPFDATTTAAKTFVATEQNYTGPITVTASSPGIVSIAPASGTGPSASFTVTPLNGGTTTLTVADNHTPQQSVKVAVTVSSGKLSLAPNQLNLTTVAPSNTATFTATETNYAGPLTASSFNPGVATVSPASQNGPTATFTVTAVGSGTTTISVVDQNANQSFLNVTVAGAFSVTPTSLLLGTPAAQTINVSEASYSGTFKATSTCTAAVATFSPASANGPNAIFTVTPVANGTCAITIADDHSPAVTVPITVQAGAFTVNPTSAQTINLFQPATTFTITASESNFSGAFTASSSAAGVAAVSAATIVSGAPNASSTFTVSPVSNGTATITVSDGTVANTKTIPVTVTGKLAAADTTIAGTTSAGSVVATEPYYSGPLTIVLASGCTNVKLGATTTVNASGGAGSSASFPITAVSYGSCGATVTDNHGQSDPATITVSAGPLTVSPSGAQTINLFPTQTGQFTITASELNFDGTFTATPSATGVVSIGAAAVTAPAPAKSATFAVTGAAPGAITITVADGHGGSSAIPVTVTGQLAVSGGSIPATASSTTLVASEPYYSGPITVTPSGCAAVATFPTLSANAPGGAGSSVSFPVNAVSAGSCTAAVSDTRQTVSATISVAAGTLTVTPATVTFSKIGASGAQTLTAAELNYTGAITSSGCSGIVTIPGSVTMSGGQAKFTTTADAAGTCTLTFKDTNTPQGSDTVVVTVPGPLTTDRATGIELTLTPTQTITVSDPNYPGAFTETNTCAPDFATVTGPTGGNVWTVTDPALGGLGPCTITFTDTVGNPAATVTVQKTVSPSAKLRRRFTAIGARAVVNPLGGPPQSGKLTASETSLTMRLGGGTNATHMISIVEAGYAGAFTATSSRTDVATVSLANSAGGNAQLTISAQTAGSALVTVTDANGVSLTIPVTVSATRSSSGPGPGRRPAPAETPSAPVNPGTTRQQF